MHLAFFKAATWRVISMASLLVTGVYTLWLYSAYLRPERYGVLALALAVLNYLPYLDGGFRTVISRMTLATTDPADRACLLEFGQKFYTRLGFGVVALALVAMTIYGLMPGARAENLPVSFFVVFGVANALLVSANTQFAVFVAAQQQSRVYILYTLGAWAGVNALAWGLARGWELWAIPFGTLVSAAVTYPLGLRWIKKAFPGLKIFDPTTGENFWKQFHRLKSEAWFCFRSQVTTVVLYSADILIIGYFCNKAEVAVYYVIMRLVGMTRSLLQTGGEVGWPFLAQRGGGIREFAIPWFGLHGWIYGSVAGALVVVTIPFCIWYMGASWTASPVLLWLVVVRFLIVGLGSSATYLLFAIGEFKPITKCLEGELIAGVILGTLGGYFYGLLGVATGFLIATIGGTLVPVYVAYARRGAVSLSHILATVWSRALLGFIGSYITATLLLRTLQQGIYMPIVGSAAVAVSLVLAFGFALSRNGFQLHFESGQLRQLLRKI